MRVGAGGRVVCMCGHAVPEGENFDPHAFGNRDIYYMQTKGTIRPPPPFSIGSAKIFSNFFRAGSSGA